MARNNLLNTRTTNLLELVGNGRIYRVPPYQRDYSWEVEQWEDLWNDLLELRGRPDDRHYMGALVVEGKSDREFLIIDGQQRLATLSLLALAVIAKLKEMADRGSDPEANQERAARLRSRFIGEKDPASLIESSKLFLNETDDGFYQDYLVQLRRPLNPKGLTKSNRLLWECFSYYQEGIESVPGFATDGAALAELVSETIARQLMFILITVEDEINAYTVFETLNARGLELTTTDLLKNYLFSRVQVASDLQALQRRWRSLITTVRQERFPEFLRFHLLCEQPKIRTQRLFKLLRERAKTPLDVFALLALDTGNQRKKLAKYILARLEQDASGRACDPDTDPATIEHILPENPLDDWANDFPREHWDEAVYRLGNLTPLDSASNRRVANRSYTEKLAAYGQSAYTLTRKIAEMAPEHWTLKLLEARQQQLARRAVHLWRSDSV